MASIVSLTFNPCIDKSFTVPSLVPEKKLPCSAPVFEPGGGGINVARAIKRLGGEALAMYFAGHYNGNLLTTLLAGESIPTRVIEISQSTRENTIVMDRSTNLQYRFNLPGPLIKEPEWRQSLALLEKEADMKYLVVSGSFPPGVPLDILGIMASLAKSKQARLIIDTSGEALKMAAQQEVFLIKPSMNELAFLAGTSDSPKDMEPESLAHAARWVLRQGHCHAVLVSMGARGAILVTRDLILRVNSPEVEVKSTVGAGDSMVAGTVLALSRGKRLEEAALYGVACGTAATLNSGTGLCQLQEVDRLHTQMLLQDNLVT
jgi:6-phosphofructokinase 2